jgi:hypothetical protein
MNYRVKITYLDGWMEETVSITETVYAENYVEALRLILDKYDFTDEDIKDVEVKAVTE